MFSYFGAMVNAAINDEKTKFQPKTSVIISTYLFCIQWLINDFWVPLAEMGKLQWTFSMAMTNFS